MDVQDAIASNISAVQIFAVRDSSCMNVAWLGIATGNTLSVTFSINHLTYPLLNHFDKMSVVLAS